MGTTHQLDSRPSPQPHTRADQRMYFITEQFYQVHPEGFLSVLTAALFGQNKTTKNQEEAGRQPRLLDLHLASINQNNEEEEETKRLTTNSEFIFYNQISHLEHLS